MSTFVETLRARGFIYQSANLEALDQFTGQLAAYVGFDATAPQLHVGHLLPLMALRWYQKFGGKAICVLGGATTRIGDPSGRDTTRTMLDEDTIRAYAAQLETFFKKFFAEGDVVLTDNAAWFDNLGYIDFLRQIGVHFSVNRLLTFEQVKRRLEANQPLSFIEFNYMTMQGYDFLHLLRTQGCVLQMGGSDQWGNILCGIDLIRRCADQDAAGLTFPLVTTADGRKMGKSASGALWLSDAALSPYLFWQFWRDTADADVERFLKWFTFLSLPDIERLTAEGADLNGVKVILADAVTTIVHGAEILDSIHAAQHAMFGDGDGLDISMLPSVIFEPGRELLYYLIALDFAASRGEARRLIRGGGVMFNRLTVVDETYVVTENDFVDSAVIQVGKKRHGVLKRS